MYFAFVALTMFVLPLASIAGAHVLHPEAALVDLTGRWFVFWGAGVRLGVAGLRQYFQPSFTAQNVFGLEGNAAWPLVRELGVANFATGLVGGLSLFRADFVLPVAIAAGLFYGVAGARHAMQEHRSRHETIAMVSDVFLFVVLAVFVLASFR
ncbi:MAG TPA: DUF6790 family protein [Rhizomicrobium sp.]|jgi:hypothetical protein